MGDTTPPPAAGQKEELKTEAAELTADIAEAKEEAAEARKSGQDERADRLEASIAKTQADLDEIKAMLKGLTDRPFHPAPGDGDQAPSPEAEPGEKDEVPPGPDIEEQTKPKKRHWLYGDRWNQE